MNNELKQKLIGIINAARLVVPTSEKCPLHKALKDFDDYLEEDDAKEFKKRYEGNK